MEGWQAGGYRGRRGGRKGGSSGGGSTTMPKAEEFKAISTPGWTPKKVGTKDGWTDAQIRKVFNTLIKQGMTQQQAVSRIASLWDTRFRG